MKKISLIIFCLIVFTLPVSAVTLNDALKQTYENNLELKAERKKFRSSKRSFKYFKK
jgi:outer membrane protein